MTLTRNRAALIPAAAALAGIALLAGCAGSSSGDSAASSAVVSKHNSADVTFASDMIPHHAQAVEMADMALAKATDAEVKNLAQAIKGAQDPEITTMTGWLTSWNQPVPMAGMGHAGSGHTGAGMMSADEMAQLDRATGPAFDTLWVDMMTRHHTGAIEMAKAELASGQYAQAKALAQQIVTSQTAEVATMAGIAKRLG